MAKKKILNRRQFLKVSAGSAAALSLGAGNLFKPVKSFGQSTKELTVAISVDPGNLDMRLISGMPGYSVMRHMLETVMWRDEKMNLIPWLIDSYEIVNPLSIKMKVRRGIKFHNGRAFTAEAIKVTIDDIKAPGSKSLWAGYCNPIKDIQIVDDMTLLLKFDEPNRPQLRNLTMEGILEPKAFKELGNKIATNPIGSGPYKLIEYVPGQYVSMEAFNDYWGPKPKSRMIKWRFIPENGTRLAALESGEVMMINNLPPDQVARIRNNPDLEVRDFVTARMTFIGIRCDREPFNDVRIRQAMNFAVNKEAIVKSILRGYGQPASTPMAPMVFGFNPKLKPYPYDPKKAEDLLAQAGAKGTKVTLGCPIGRYLMGEQVGEAVAGFLQKVGFDVSFEAVEWATWLTELYKLKKSKYDLHLSSWGTINMEPDYALKRYFHSKWTDVTGYQNVEVDKLIDEGRAVFNDEKVKEIYNRVQELIWDDYPAIFLYYQPEITGVNRKLKGFQPFPDEYLRLWNAYVA